MNPHPRLLGTLAAFAILITLFMPRDVSLQATQPAMAPAAWANDLTRISRSDWNYQRAAHLLERAGFGGTPDEIARLAAMSPDAAVNSLVDYEGIDGRRLLPFDESGIWDPGMDPFPPSRAEAVRIGRERGRALGVNILPEGSPR